MKFSLVPILIMNYELFYIYLREYTGSSLCSVLKEQALGRATVQMEQALGLATVQMEQALGLATVQMEQALGLATVQILINRKSFHEINKYHL